MDTKIYIGLNCAPHAYTLNKGRSWMPRHDANTLHIFAPTGDPFRENWVEQILGAVIKPLVTRYPNDISYLWITRYSGLYGEDALPIYDHLPELFRADNYFRCVKFRIHVSQNMKDIIHKYAINLSEAAGCFPDPKGWIPYNPIEDLGSKRFVHPDASYSERSERARLISTFMDATVRLMLDSLSCENGEKWTLEANALPGENPGGSFYESLHHLFCNATGVPTTVLIEGEWSSLQVRTYWMYSLTLAGQQGRQNRIEVPIHY